MPIEQRNLAKLVEESLKAGGRAHMRPVIEKEILHYDILYALDAQGLLDGVTFQGGTSLRLCYGSPRFSEDLDFAGGRDFSSASLARMRGCIEEYIGKRYGLEVFVKEPEGRAGGREEGRVHVRKWQISVVTAPENRHLPRQRIKLEVVNIPAYTREPRALVSNYAFLPDGYGDMLIMVESLDEIMADKMVSLVNCQSYVRYRDIWDLRWLVQKGARLDVELVREKINDYNVEEYLEKLQGMKERLPEIIHDKQFRDQMSRFIPMEIQDRTLLKEKFYPFLVRQTEDLFDELAARIGDGGKVDDFLM